MEQELGGESLPCRSLEGRTAAASVGLKDAVTAKRTNTTTAGTCARAKRTGAKCPTPNPESHLSLGG